MINIILSALCAWFGTTESTENQSMNALNPREQNIVAVAAYAATDNQDELKLTLTSGLDGKIVTVNEYKEILVQVYAYCGFPRSLNALNTFMVLLNERGNRDVQGKLPDPLPSGKSIDFGSANQTKLLGRKVGGALFEFAPAIDEYLKAHLFGDIFARNNLDWRTREIATIAMLSAMCGTESQLKSHIQIGKHNGLSDVQITAILTLVRDKVKGGAHTSDFPFGEENTAYAQYFVGKSYLSRLTSNDALNVPVSNVTFEPACRNNWHVHTGGQLLIVVGGIGYYQERGKPARKLVPGDVVEIPLNVEHWHGAAPDHWFAHLAIACNPKTNRTSWLEPVSDTEYRVATATRPASNTNTGTQKTFPSSDKVCVEKVFYKNHFDITLAGDLYFPVGMDKTQKHSAIIVGHPYGGVKEQCSGLYAQEMAKRGFVALAFDYSFSGESGGMPRQTVSPEIYADDFSASVDFLGRLPFVNRNKIGVIGICGSGGFAIAAAGIDPRIRALATVSMYDMGRATRQGVNDTITQEQRKKNLDAIAEQRWKEADGENVEIRFGTPEKLPEHPSQPTQAFFDYYRGRAYHPHYRGQKVTTTMSLMNFYPFARIAEIAPRPLLFIAGEKAHSRYFSEDAFKLATNPKELYIVPNAGHVDLYDQIEKIPFDKLTEFFSINLNNPTEGKQK